nr:C25 family cysteine peptidase [Bradyrhizobium tropiciagri]
MTSDDVAKGTKRDTIVAAECCFGAQLFDPQWSAGKLPISNAYLAAGAVGFFGSTTTAYGPEEGNSGADLITQYFLINALGSASTGRSSLQARQKFVSGQKMEDPVNLKTLAQFLLLGDPSLQPCLSAGPKAINHSAARKTRRVALTAAGKAAFDSSGFPGKRIVRPPKALHDVVRKVAREKGMRAGREDLESFHIVGGEDYGAEMKSRKVQQSVFVVTNSKRPSGKRPKHIPDIHVLVAHAQDNRLIRVEAYVRR